jgi:hypothetical protein
MNLFPEGMQPTQEYLDELSHTVAASCEKYFPELNAVAKGIQETKQKGIDKADEVLGWMKEMGFQTEGCEKVVNVHMKIADA